MKTLKITAILLLILSALAAVLPFLIPVKHYIPTLAKLASERLGEPVSIRDLRFALLPLPSVTVEDIRIGPEQEVRIGSVSVHPDLASLASKVKILRRVEVEGITVDRALLDRLPKWMAAGEGPKTVLIQRIEARHVNLALGDFRWGPLEAEAVLGEGGLRVAEMGTADRSLRVTLKPGEEGYAVDLAAHNFTLPVKPALRFDALQGSGTLTAAGLTLPHLEGKLYGGELVAQSDIGWKDGLRIAGEARVSDVEIEPIVKLMGQSASVSGRLHASGRYALAAQEASHLADSLRAQFRFEVKRGVLYNFDLASAVRALSRDGTRGGQTTFNEFSGNVILVGRNVQLRDVKVASGLLRAQGDVDIAASRKLSGRVNVEMKGTASLVSVPLEVAGTLQDPVLFPNRAALAGAAVGTGLMGPGLGTTVGAKAGEALDRLFK